MRVAFGGGDGIWICSVAFAIGEEYWRGLRRCRWPFPGGGAGSRVNPSFAAIGVVATKKPQKTGVIV